MKTTWTIFLLSTLLLAGCEKAREARQAASNLQQLSQVGEKMETAMKDAEGHRAERVKSGDTLALPYKDLQAYLPATLDGYTGGEPEGQSMKTAGMAFSSAGRTYKQGDNTLEIKLVDYNGAGAMYQGATAMFALGLESEDDQSLTRTAPLKQDGVKAMETLNKKTGDAELMLAVGDRFFMSVKADHQKDLTLVEQVAQQLELEKLAKL